MKHLKKFEAYGSFMTGNDLVDAVYYNEYNDAKKLLDNGFDVNCIDNTTKNTALLYAAYYGKWDFVYLLLKYNPDWNIKDSSDTDFIEYIEEYLGGEEVLDKIKKDYPKEYQDYLIKKDIKKYNL